MKEENLIFIASQPRAGSTYLQNLLSNNKQTNTVSEPWIMLGLAPLFKPELINARYDYKLTYNALADYEAKFEELNIKNEVKAMALNMYQPMFKGFDYVIDKTPRYWEILDELVDLFPKSKIILINRNPIDVARSMINTWDIPNLDRLNRFKRDLLLAPKQIYDFSVRNDNNPNVRVINYEELIANPNTEIRIIYDWLGIQFSEEILQTDANQKHKGKYGDPYQNKKSKVEKELTKPFMDFLLGYANYLGKDFLNLFGSYTSIEMKKTKAFQYFLDVDEYKHEKTKNSLKRKFLLRYRRMFI